MATQKRLEKRRRNRAFRVRKKVRGTAERPRVSVHRTLKHIYVQVVDDEAGHTLASTNSKALKLGYGGNVDAAKQVGAEIGKIAKEKGISEARFDRGPYRYHGRVKAIADAIREAGVKF